MRALFCHPHHQGVCGDLFRVFSLGRYVHASLMIVLYLFVVVFGIVSALSHACINVAEQHGMASTSTPSPVH